MSAEEDTIARDNFSGLEEGDVSNYDLLCKT
jgi:hypothetical protein